MKKSSIAVIIVLALSIGAVISMVSDAGTYASFSQASVFPDKEFQVVGTLNKDKELEYNPHINANLFSFYLIDRDGRECKVNFNGTKPQDFERSEQVVLTGKFTGEEFQASKILMKCPSKYNEGANNNGFTEVEAESL